MYTSRNSSALPLLSTNIFMGQCTKRAREHTCMAVTTNPCSAMAPRTCPTILPATACGCSSQPKDTAAVQTLMIPSVVSLNSAVVLTRVVGPKKKTSSRMAESVESDPWQAFFVLSVRSSNNRKQRTTCAKLGANAVWRLLLCDSRVGRTKQRPPLKSQISVTTATTEPGEWHQQQGVREL